MSNKPAILKSVPTEIEANLIKGLLTGHGIETDIEGILTSGFRAEAPGQVHIVVHEDDLQKAQEILDEINTKKINWDEEDIAQDKAPGQE